MSENINQKVHTRVKLKRGQQTNVMVVPTPFHQRSAPMNKKTTG